ncbi:hypothetical protein MRX96_049437 [Rhipicephalus microplus]
MPLTDERVQRRGYNLSATVTTAPWLPEQRRVAVALAASSTIIDRYCIGVTAVKVSLKCFAKRSADGLTAEAGFAGRTTATSRSDTETMGISEMVSLVQTGKAMSLKLDKLTVLRMVAQHINTIRGTCSS